MPYSPRNAKLAVVLALFSGLALTAGCGLDAFVNDFVDRVWPFGDNQVQGVVDVDPNEFCEACDPNEVCQPGEPCDPNEVCPACDPNAICESDLGIAGTYEIASLGDFEGSWDLPDSPIALHFEQSGDPLNRSHGPQEPQRYFTTFGPEGSMEAGYGYWDEEGVVYVESDASGNPFIGRSPIVQEDGSLLFEDVPMMIGPMGNELALDCSMGLLLWSEDEGQSWLGRMTATYRITAEQNIPAVPEMGLPAIQAGDQAVFTVAETLTLASSPGPALLFPDAEWQITPDDEAINSSVPTGYCEITGPNGEIEDGWSDPESPILQLFVENGNSLDDMEQDPIVEEGRRLFILYDEYGLFATIYDYDIAENVLGISGDSKDNPFIGRAPTLTEGGNAWQWVAEMPPETDPDGVVTMNATFEFTVAHGDLADGRELTVRLVFEITINQDIPENPETGRPAIPPGSTVQWEQLATYALTTSESPFAMFPDAELAIEDDEDDEQTPSGYYEIADATNRSAGWNNPESPMAQIIGPESLPGGIRDFGDRTFGLFDEYGRLVESSMYMEAENTVYLQVSRQHNHFIGVGCEVQQDDVVLWVTGSAANMGQVYCEVSAQLRLDPGDDDEGRTFVMWTAITYTALEDIPEDPGQGTPAVPAGTKATYAFEEHYTLRCSDGPYEIYGGANFIEME